MSDTVWYRLVKDLNGNNLLDRKIFKNNETPPSDEMWFEGSYRGRMQAKPNIVGYVIPHGIISDLESIEWNLLYSKDFSDMNDKKFLFLKKDVVTNHIAKYRGDSSIVYVGQNDRDFILTKNNVSVECKTNLSTSLYKKNGNLKSNFTIKVYDSNGTNTNSYPNKSMMADIYMLVMKDGVFAVTGDIVWSHSKSHGDGFRATISTDYFVEVTGQVVVTDKIKMNTRERIKKILKEVV